MAAFIGWLAGMMLGGTFADFEGAMVLGAAGLVGGFLWDRRRKSAERTEDGERARSTAARLEHRLDRIEARLARLEGTAPDPRMTPAREAAAAAAPASKPAPVAPVPVAAAQVSVPPPAARAAVEPPVGSPGADRPADNALVAFLMGGNTIVRVGLVILFVGLAFLVKYAADRRILPDELKVAMVGASGIALLVVGWRLRDRRRGYGLSLQGAGVAVLYLTVLGALRLYDMIPPAGAFVVLALIVAFAAVLAVAQDALALAVIAAGGGFLAPVLVSTGQGDHVTLFSYYLVLNAGLVLIAWHRAWRVLNVLGFAFTFVIGSAWGVLRYEPQHFATTEAFLIAFFALYVAIAVLFARRESPRLRRYVDGTIVFGTPIAAFGLQAGLVGDIEFGLAYSSLALSATYVLLATALQRVGREGYRLLTEAFLAMGVVFATLAIPLALDARWTSAAWAAEGMAIYWIGVRQGSPLPRAFALLLQLFAGAAFMLAYPGLQGGRPLIGAAFVGAMLIALAGLGTNRLMHRVPSDASTAGRRAWEREVAPILFGWGFAWLMFGALHEVDAFVPDRYQPVALVAVLTLVVSTFAWLSQRWTWREASWPFLGYLPVLALVALTSAITMAHPFARFGSIAWPVAIHAQVVMLRRLEPADGPRRRWFGVLHALTLLLVAALGAWELGWLAGKVTSDGTAWTAAALLLVPALLVYGVTHARYDTRWPFTPETFGRSHRAVAAPAIVTLMALWSVVVNVWHDGRSDPLPYVPLLNAIDLGHVVVALSVVALWLCARRTGQPSAAPFLTAPFRAVAAALVFLWLNAILLRSIHHWTGIAYDFDDLMRSVLVQSALSVSWALLALAVMLFATRRALRAPWLVGASLMGVVVIKLLLVDLSRASGVERIVSFIGVGLLMLVVGYVAPVPPRLRDGSSAAGAEGIA